MALAITVTPEPAQWAVNLASTGAVGAVSWYRVEARDILLGTGVKLVDRGPPLNTPVSYYAKDTSSTVSGGPVTVAADMPVLSSAMSAGGYPVTVLSARPKQGEGRSVWHPVIGRADPFVSVFPALFPAGELVIRCATNSERLTLIGLLGRGEPLLLRSTCPERVDSMTFLMVSWSDPYLGEAKSGPCDLTISYQQVTDVAPAYVPPARTWQDVLTENPLWSDVLTGYNTWQDLLDGRRVA